MNLIFWSWSTAIFYTLVVVLTSLLSGLSQKKEITNNIEGVKIPLIKIIKPYLLFAFLIPWVVAGVRYSVASDYYSYIRMYNEIASMGLIRSIESFRAEPGYVLLNWLIFNIFNEPQYVFIISSFIVLFFIYTMVLYNKEHIKLGYATFVFMVVFYFWTWTPIRMSIAFAIVFYSYKFVEEKNLFKFSMFILFASLFHYTALMILPMYFAVNSSKEKRIFVNLIIYSSIVFMMLFLNHFFETIFYGTKYLIYQEGIGNIQSGINQTIIRLPIALFLLLFRKKLIDACRKNVVFIRIYFIGFIISFFTLWLGTISRFINYFDIVQVILIASFFNMKTNLISKNEKLLFGFLLILYYIFMFTLSTLTNERMVPYNTFWQWSL